VDHLQPLLVHIDAFHHLNEDLLQLVCQLLLLVKSYEYDFHRACA